MLFNSLEFLVFLPVTFLLYWGLFSRKKQSQNLFLIAASYLFYGWWDWRFLILIVLSTVVDYLVGLELPKAEGDKIKKRRWLWLSLGVNIGMLGFFKYYNFFVDSFAEMLGTIGYQSESLWTLNIILPVGISFYTFQTLSYTLDIYQGKIRPTRSLVDFATYVAFFPQLVAGPIEQASSLLPQIARKKRFTYTQAAEGMKLMLWGFFKKLVIADALAPIVDDIFMNYSQQSSSTLLLGTVLFGFQIYGDFSGYSDIAIGTAKLFGIELRSNFLFPYFSRNIAEFWRRWHISLSSWFMNYLYIPLGGSREGLSKTLRNVFIVFLVSGVWHGANWTFIIWGGLHACYYLPVLLLRKSGKKKFDKISHEQGRSQLGYKAIFPVLLTFGLVSFSWIFFRSPSVEIAFDYISLLFTDLSYTAYMHPRGYRMVDFYIILIFFVLYEFRIRKDERSPFPFRSAVVRFFCYFLSVFAILLFFDDGLNRSFIYFQF